MMHAETYDQVPLTLEDVLFPEEGMLPLVAYLTKVERKAARGTKVVYNCLLPEGEAMVRSSFRFAWPAEMLARAIREVSGEINAQAAE